jgi:hypothetical protein
VKTLAQEFEESSPSLASEFERAGPGSALAQEFEDAAPKPPESLMTSAQLEAAKRDLQYGRHAASNIVKSHKIDFLTGSELGEESDLGPMALQQAKDWMSQREQSAGGLPSSARAVEASGAVETPGVIRTFLEAGMRPAGAAVVSLAEQSEARIKRENPGMPQEEVNRRVVAEQSGLAPWKRMAIRPGEFLEAAKQAAFAYHPLDPKHETNQPGNKVAPTIIKALPQIIEQYGENRPVTSEPVLNAIRALVKTSEAIAPTPQTAIARIAEGKSPLESPWAPVGPEEERSTKSIPAPWGRMSAAQGAALGTAAAFTPAGDLNQLILGGAGKAIGGAARTGGAVVGKVAPRASAAVNLAGERAGQAIRTSGPAQFFRGTPAVAEKIAVDVGDPTKAAEIARALESVGPKQIQELKPVMEAVLKAKKVPASEWENVWISLQDLGPRAEGTYASLSPAAKEVADAYKALRESHGASMLKTAGTIPRKQYAYGGNTPEALEQAGKSTAPVPPSGVPEIAPKLGGYHKRATLADQLTVEARMRDIGAPPVVTLPEINRAIDAAQGPVAAAQKAVFGAAPKQVNPAKNIAQRFGQGAMEKAWAETIQGTFAPLARRVVGKVPDGWSGLPTTSMAQKVLEHSVPGKGTVILPKSAVNAIAKSWSDKTVLERIMSSAPVQAWRASTTTLSGPGYHGRNFIYNIGKLADEFRPGELAKIESQMARLKAGDPAFKQIAQAARDAGTWEGTGAAPGSVIRNLRLEAGLPSGRKGWFSKPLDYLESKTPTFRKGFKAASDVATSVDESARMRAILGYVNRGSTPEQSVAQARSLVTYTGNKSPAEKLTNLFAPFPTWFTREAPRAAARMAGGGLTWPVKVQNYMEATVPQKDQVPERFQPRRFREQSGVPLAGKSAEGFARGMAIPASPVGPVTQALDATTQALQGAPFGDVSKAAADTVLNQLWGPVSWAGAEMFGRRPLTDQQLGSVQKASGWTQLVGEHFPDLAKKIGIIKNPRDGKWYTTVRTAMYLGFVPYGGPARAIAAGSPEEQGRYLSNYLTGVPVVTMDPSRENQAQDIELQKKVKDAQEELRKYKGIVLPRGTR